MKEIRLAEKRKYSDKEFKSKFANENDCLTIIDEPCKIYVGDKLSAVLLYDVMIEDSARFAIRNARDWIKGTRGSGVSTHTLTVGYQPRAPTRSQESCHASKISHTQPWINDNIMQLAPRANGLYKEHCPDAYNEHKDYTYKNILPDWIIKDTVFTSGVINKNCSMGYHKDRGNITSGWSAMYVIRKNMLGADLNVIDFDARLILPDKSLLLFNGQNYMHGVTPLQKLGSKDSYRYSIVFYTLQNLTKCLCKDEELKRAQLKRTEREERRAGLIK